MVLVFDDVDSYTCCNVSYPCYYCYYYYFYTINNIAVVISCIVSLNSHQPLIFILVDYDGCNY